MDCSRVQRHSLLSHASHCVPETPEFPKPLHLNERWALTLEAPAAGRVIVAKQEQHSF